MRAHLNPVENTGTMDKAYVLLISLLLSMSSAPATSFPVTVHAECPVQPLNELMNTTVIVGANGRDFRMVSDGDALYIAGVVDSEIPTVATGNSTYYGRGDLFVARLQPDGTVVWSAIVGGGGGERLGDLVISDGMLYLLGSTNSASMWESEVISSVDVLVAKIDASDGSVVNVQRHGAQYDDFGYGLSVNSGGTIYISGMSGDPEVEYGNPNPNPFLGGVASGRYDMFFAEIDSNLDVIDGHLYGSSINDGSTGIHVSDNGVLYYTGFTMGSFSVSKNAPDGSNLGVEGVIAYYPLGGLGLSTFFGKEHDEYPTRIIADSTGNIYVVGNMTSWDYPYLRRDLGNSSEVSRAFVVKLGSDDRYHWVNGIYGDSDSGYTDLVLHDDLPIATGWSSSKRALEPSSYFGENLGGRDALVAKYAADGDELWITNLGTELDDVGYTTQPVDGGYATLWGNDEAIYLTVFKEPTLDTDGDRFSDADEFSHGTSYLCSDTDGDGLTDYQEVRVFGSDPLLQDTDGDGLDDLYETNTTGSDPTLEDTDGDGLDDLNEVFRYRTDPNSVDTDNDTMDDAYEVSYPVLDPSRADAGEDPDSDGLTNVEEMGLGTDPGLNDTDSDGLPDGDEVDLGTDPLNPDSDGDGFFDGEEVAAGIDPLDPDLYPRDWTPTEETPLIGLGPVMLLAVIRRRR